MLTKDMSKINFTLDYAIDTFPHVLIAGTTGSGKSVCLNKALYSMLALKLWGQRVLVEKLLDGERPKDKDFDYLFSLTLIDTKRVELRQYAKLCYTKNYVTEPEAVPAVLDRIIDEMESRYSEMTGREWKGDNHYIVIDELADLVNGVDKKLNSEILSRLVKIGRLGRAAHIKIVACTQDPSRNTLSSQLMQNFPCCIALRCKSDIESRQILGVSGAENIQEYGIAYCVNPEDGKCHINFGMTNDRDIDEVIDALNILRGSIMELLRKPTIFERIRGKRIMIPQNFEEDGFFESFTRTIASFIDYDNENGKATIDEVAVGELFY